MPTQQDKSPRFSLALAAVTLFGLCTALAGVDPTAPIAPRMEFTPPRPGSYALQRIQPIEDATLLAPSGRAVRISALTQGKMTLLTFFYTYCADPLGCPFAYHTLTDVRDWVLKDTELAKRVRFLSVSLDPTTDTPAAIGRYHDMVTRNSAFEWDVLTARSVHELLPVLEDFGQDVSVEPDSKGAPQRTVHHMLKMFLIDRSGFVREIYTLAFLQPRVIENDIQTLYLEERAQSASALASNAARSVP